VNSFYLIGLTGNLGSGKSTVRKMLEELGARGIDADALAHVAMARGTPTWRAIIETFGADIVTYNGRIDRQKLSERVFADANGLKRLEAIVHPAVGALIKQSVSDEQASVIVVEAIKLIEAGLHAWCDAVWVVKCEPNAQVERVMRERHMSEADARARLGAQSALADKLKHAQVVIDNSADETATHAEVERAWRAIRPETARDKRAWLYDLPPDSATRAAPPVAAMPTAPPPPKPKAQPEIQSPPTPVWVRAKPSAASTEPAVEQKTGKAPVPQSPAWATVEADVEVRRARRTDLDSLSVALARLENRGQPLSRAETVQRFGERGYFIVLSEKRIVALASWEAENLVAIVPEIWVESPDTAPVVLPKLFALIEGEARRLLCEVVLLLIKESALTLSAEANAAGYDQREPQTLHLVWRTVAQERLRASHQIWLKPLREGITTKPI
jgi:dephospho-CoA kinase